MNRVVILLSLLLFGSCTEKIEPGTVEKVPPVTLKAKVEIARITQRPVFQEFVGTVQAKVSSTVSGKITGTIREVRVREGDAVKSGDVLVVIDDRQVSARMEQAEAALAEARKAEAAARSALEAARAGRNLAQATYERYSKLMKDQAATSQEFDEVTAKHLQAQAVLSQTETMAEAARFRVRQAEAALDGARLSRNDAVVTAPYDGVVTARRMDIGDLASAGLPLISLEQTGDFRVDLILPESRIQWVCPGQSLQVRIPSVRPEPLSGKVKTIVPSADPQTRSFVVQIDIPETNGVHSGMFARVVVPLREEEMLLIPAAALVQEGQLTGVFVVNDDNIAGFRLIRTGRKFEDNFEVLSGLADGTRYVVDPPARLVNGARLEVSS